MTLATEIIGDLRQRMVKTNQAMEDTMDRIARARAVVEVIWRAAEKDAVVSDALGGVMSGICNLVKQMYRDSDTREEREILQNWARKIAEM